MEYDSIDEICTKYGISSDSIKKACAGKNKTCTGFQWRRVLRNSSIENLPAVTYLVTQDGRAVCQIDENGEIIAKYKSIAEASRMVGVNSKSIRCVLNGTQKRAGGYYWTEL